MEIEENLESGEIDEIIDDVESEFFSFEFAPAITRTQRNSVASLMRGVAEKVQDVFRSYRREEISFAFSSADSLLMEEFAGRIQGEAVLFSFDFEGILCFISVPVELYRCFTGIREISRNSMGAADSKLCFDFVVKPVLSEILRKFNAKSSVPLNFRTPKVTPAGDFPSTGGRCVCALFEARAAGGKFPVPLCLPLGAFERLVRLGVFSRPRRPLQNPHKNRASVVLDRIYLDPNVRLSVGSVIETTRRAADGVEILQGGKKVAEGELVAVREMFGVRKRGR